MEYLVRTVQQQIFYEHIFKVGMPRGFLVKLKPTKKE